jgi:hypothetical protein
MDNRSWQYEIIENGKIIAKATTLQIAIEYAEKNTLGNKRVIEIVSRAKIGGFPNVTYTAKDGLAI